MAKIIFEKLTVREEDGTKAGQSGTIPGLPVFKYVDGPGCVVVPHPDCSIVQKTTDDSYCDAGE